MKGCDKTRDAGDEKGLEIHGFLTSKGEGFVSAFEVGLTCQTLHFLHQHVPFYCINLRLEMSLFM